MTDIVKTLRNLADGAEAQQAPHNYVLHLRTGADEIERLRAGIGEMLLEREDARAEVERLRAALSDPTVVHANMLAGVIAKPFLAQIIHIYGEDALRAALEGK